MTESPKGVACPICGDSGELYYEHHEGPALGPCIACDHEGFTRWADECDALGHCTDCLRADAEDALTATAQPPFGTVLPF